jgi:hypothetical protein
VLEAGLQDDVLVAAGGRCGAEVDDAAEHARAGQELELGLGELGLSERAFDDGFVLLFGEVDDRAQARRDRDLSDDLALDQVRAVRPDHRARALGRCGHVDRAAVVPQPTAVAGGAVVAQHGFGTARFHRGEETALRGDVAVAHGVNTAVKEVQVPARHHALDLPRAQAEFLEFGAGHDAPLPRRELRQRANGVGGQLTTCAVVN